MAAVGTMEKHSQNANDLEHKDSKIDELHRVSMEFINKALGNLIIALNYKENFILW